MIRNTFITLLLVLLCSFTIELKAQYASFKVSADGYRGDLNKKGGINGAAVSVGYTYYIEDGLSVRSQFNSGFFSSEYTLGNGDVFPNPVPPGFSPTLYFENRHAGGDVSLQYELVTLGPATLYTGLGIGFMSFRLYDRAGKRLESQNDSRLNGETMDGSAFTAPISAGILLFSGSSAQIALEQQWILTNSDYLDNIGYAGGRGDDTLVRRSLVVRMKF